MLTIQQHMLIEKRCDIPSRKSEPGRRRSDTDARPARAVMADVAKLAGVSTATVSHYLNKTRPLLPPTEERVREAIKSLDYVRDPAARTLRAGSTNVIGIAMSAVSNPYFSALPHEIEARLSLEGRSVMIMDTHDDTDRELQVVKDLISRRVDGLVLSPSASASEPVALAHRHNVPIVLVDRMDPRYDCDQVGSKSEDAMYKLTTHLMDLGHKRIGMITGETGLPTTAERTSGFLTAHEQKGRTVDPQLLACGNSRRMGGYIAAQQLLQLRRPPSALVSANNAMTIGMLRVLKERGVRIPADIAIVTFDDFEWADLFEPGLTAVAQPIESLADAAVDLLISRTEDRTLPPRRVRLEPTIMHRTSCGCQPSQELTPL